MPKILKAENIQTDLLGSNGNNPFSLQRNNSSILTLNNSDNVGIGTTSPSHKLEVRGSSYPKICITSDDQAADFGANFRIDLRNASNSLFEGGTISVRHNSSNQTANAENTYMSFFTRLSGVTGEKLRIDSSGRIGLGTTTTTDAGMTITTFVSRDNGWDAKLALQSTGSGDYPTLLFSGCSTASRYGAIVQTTSTSGANAASITSAIYFENSSATAGNIVFATNNNIGVNNPSERLRIKSTGEIGIGTNNPQTSLQINGTQPRIRLEENSAGSKRLELLINSSGEAIIDSTQSGSSILFSTVGVERLRIDSSGNVGIGTATLNPIGTTRDLIISAGTTGTSTASITLQGSRTSDTGFCGLYLYHQSNNVGLIQGRRDGADDAGNLAFYTKPTGGVLAERLRIDSSGRVGIGTTSPQDLLHVASSSASIRIQDSDTIGNGSNSLTAFVQFRDSAATQVGYVGFGGEANFSLWNQQNSNLLFATNNAERLRITSGGNVGIGTNNPSTRLHVNGVITHSAGTIGSNANGARTVTTTTTAPSNATGSDGDIIFVV